MKQNKRFIWQRTIQTDYSLSNPEVHADNLILGQKMHPEETFWGMTKT